MLIRFNLCVRSLAISHQIQPQSVKEFRRFLRLRGPDPPGIKSLPPRHNGMRHARIADRSHLWKGKPVRFLTKALRKKGGRNNTGRITVRGRGGGHKRRWRNIDFKRDLYNIAGITQRLEYDPCRSAWIALVDYPEAGERDKERLRYIIAPEGLEPGDKIMSSRDTQLDIHTGNTMPIQMMPVGTVCHNIEFFPRKGGQVARSAGTFVKIMEKDNPKGYCKVQMQSKEVRLFKLECMATIGKVCNPNHHLISLGKAGRRRNMGFRPKVRGVAMNAVDHPHGGGEGRSSPKKPSVSKWGKPTKGYRTRKKNKWTNKWIVQRRPPNRKKYPELYSKMTS